MRELVGIRLFFLMSTIHRRACGCPRLSRCINVNREQISFSVGTMWVSLGG